jgi:hypothetical protein
MAIEGELAYFPARYEIRQKNGELTVAGDGGTATIRLQLRTSKEAADCIAEFLGNQEEGFLVGFTMSLSQDERQQLITLLEDLDPERNPVIGAVKFHLEELASDQVNFIGED